MPGAYIVTEAIFVITLVITASAYASTMFNVMDEVKLANQLKLEKIKREAATAIEPVFGYVPENRSSVLLWLKNVGAERISPTEIQAFEVFIIGRNTLIHAKNSHNTYGWRYELVKDIFPDNSWSWGETLFVKISLESPLEPGEYVVRIAGVYSSVTYVLSVGG